MFVNVFDNIQETTTCWKPLVRNSIPTPFYDEWFLVYVAAET